MDGGRRRSASFHEDPDAPPLPDFLDPNVPPMPDFSSLQESSEMTENGSEEEEDPDFETLIRTRSRSKSLHDSEEDISNKILANAHVHPIAPAVTTPELELAGPINDREAAALQRGLEEAAGVKDAQAEKEERAELEAAARERLKRASNASSMARGDIGTEPIYSKVKVLLLGDSGVGKSSIIQRWFSNTFCPSLVSTLGVDLKSKRLHVDDKVVQVQVWDTAGQQAFHKITASYYKGSNAILLVYDISDRSTFTNIEYWMKSIKGRASENVKVALLGNKMDLRGTEGLDCVSKSEGQKAADKYKVFYSETSAMTSGIEVDEAFEKIVRRVLGLEHNSILKKGRFSSDGTRSPESSIFSKKEPKKEVPKPALGKVQENSGDPDGGIDENGKKKDCVIS